jgi:N utilization substance protein A
VRLAAELTGWNIDIYSESKLEEMAKKAKATLVEALGIEEATATILYSQAFRSPEEIAEASLEALHKVPGMSKEKLEEIRQAAIKHMAGKSTGTVEAGGAPLEAIKGVGPKTLELLKAAGLTNPTLVVGCKAEELSEKTGIPVAKANQIIENCRASLNESSEAARVIHPRA